MDIVCLRHLAYVLMPAVTVFWGESLRARFLQRGARRAIRLLLAALLAWQFLRLLKYMAEPAVPDTDEALLRLLWYLYYIFRAALPVALLWIAHVADRDAVAQRLPAHIFALLVLNLALAVAILTNEWHEQFFSFPPEKDGGAWKEEVEWGAYAYWTLWFLEVFTALAILWIKAKLQKIWRFRMVLPVVCCILFLLYSIFYNFLPAVRIDVTFTTTGFFLLLIELCLRMGLMPSNHEHEAFFREASLGLMLLDAEGAVRLVSKAAPEQGARRDCRISKMEVPGGGTLVWYEDMSLLHERQRSLAQANCVLERRSRYLRRTVPRRRQSTAVEMHQRLRREVEALLEELRPYFREFREEILRTEGQERACGPQAQPARDIYEEELCALPEERGERDNRARRTRDGRLGNLFGTARLPCACGHHLEHAEGTAGTGGASGLRCTGDIPRGGGAQPGRAGGVCDDGREDRDVPRGWARHVGGQVAVPLAGKAWGRLYFLPRSRLCRVCYL